MESDQEVTREPFENDEVGESSDKDSPIYSEEQTFSPANNARNDESYDDALSTNSAEDVDYAKQFGINLKSAKVSTAYERLINSNCFKSDSISDEQNGKSTPMIKTSTTSDCIYHKGTFYQKGDIVALCDQEDGQIYFAQIKGFLQDQFCEKSASINWLVPHRPTSRNFFDPTAYKIGLEDTQLRKLECMTFVRHCPHDYYLNKFYQDSEMKPGCSKATANLDTVYQKKSNEQSFIWTSMQPCDVPEFQAINR